MMQHYQWYCGHYELTKEYDWVCDSNNKVKRCFPPRILMVLGVWRRNLFQRCINYLKNIINGATCCVLNCHTTKPINFPLSYKRNFDEAMFTILVILNIKNLHIRLIIQTYSSELYWRRKTQMHNTCTSVLFQVLLQEKFASYVSLKHNIMENEYGILSLIKNTRCSSNKNATK